MSQRSTEPQPDQAPADTPYWDTKSATTPARDLTKVTLGDFYIDRLLGRGGMGEVYLARQISLNREIAFKVLRPDLLTNATYLARFESEAWAAAKLNDPNIVHIYSLGSIDGIRFIAMEYVQGTNLKDFLLRKGTPDLMLALSIMRQAGSAIRAAGEMGLVHRDIKPENLLLTKKGHVKVADFGLCRDMDREKPSVTQPGVTMGTPLYMSPEQAQGHALDHRSDLYSLGVTFYHMFAGMPPFHAESPIALALKHVKDTPVDLSVHRPDLPISLCKLVMRLIEKEPSSRYQSANEMLRDLAKIREAVVINSATSEAPVTTASTGISSLDMAAAFNSPNPLPSLQPRLATTQVGNSGSNPNPVVTTRSYTGLIALLLVVGLLAGGATGWFLRAPDLLAANARSGQAPSVLWLAPNWSEIPKQTTADAQYRYAQIRSDSSNRLAAWVAVAGNFPQAKDWIARAHTQIARTLFRERDTMRLRSFGVELERLDRPHEKRLGEIVTAALGALEGDVEGAINLFTFNFTDTLTDPAVAELSLEITLEAERMARHNSGSATATNLTKLRQCQNRLINKTIEIMFADTFARIPLP